MADKLFLIPLLPLVASIINLVFGRSVIRGKAHLVAIPAILGALVVSILAFKDVWDTGEPIQQHLWTWIPSGTFTANIGLYADQLTVSMLVMVTFISLLVHIYSTGYMHGDESYYRFFTWLPLFVFAMIMLLLADNYLLVFFGWEGVGLCSYLLIGYYWRRRSAGNASKKAFIVNRIGDVGFGLGIMLIFTTFGTISMHGPDGVFAKIPGGDYSSSALTAIAILLFTGAIGKSAQFPLHVWLPDAMEGPTPVSALIHAATMVTAGIYLVARSSAIFQEAPYAMMLVATIGCFTAFLGASIGLVQNDIKRVVAYSTVSQLGYMALALGVGAWPIAIFHLLSHAFFKAGLFLGSGSVIHGMHEEQDIRKMGGLRKYMPITFFTFLMASLANAGVIPFAGFWSKDEIIVGSWTSTVFPRYGNWLTVFALITAFLSAFYMFRLVFLTFFGKERFDPEVVHPHESPAAMTIPLVILAVFSIGFGLVVGWPPDEGRIHKFLEPVFAGEEAHATTGGEMASLSSTADAGYVIVNSEEATPAAGASEGEAASGEEAAHEGEHHVSDETKLRFAIISTIVALAGILLAGMMYLKGSPSPVAIGERFQGAYRFLLNKWYLDEFYNEKIVLPLRKFSMWLWQEVDVKIIDGFYMGIARSVGDFSQSLRKVQTGMVANYALAIALGMVVIVGVYLAAFSSLFR